MPTVNQLGNGMRKRKIRRDSSPALLNGPQRRCTVIRISQVTPRKPNSARRTIAKVKVKLSEKLIFAKIPGIGEHLLQAHSVVKIRGHGPKDTPGINYQLMRGAYDFIATEEFGRHNRRSKFGLKLKDVIITDMNAFANK